MSSSSLVAARPPIPAVLHNQPVKQDSFSSNQSDINPGPTSSVDNRTFIVNVNNSNSFKAIATIVLIVGLAALVIGALAWNNISFSNALLQQKAFLPLTLGGGALASLALGALIGAYITKANAEVTQQLKEGSISSKQTSASAGSQSGNTPPELPSAEQRPGSNRIGDSGSATNANHEDGYLAPRGRESLSC